MVDILFFGCACSCSSETRFASSESVVLALKWCTASNYLPLKLSKATVRLSSIYIYIYSSSNLYKASIMAHDNLLLHQFVFAPVFLYQTVFVQTTVTNILRDINKPSITPRNVHPHQRQHQAICTHASFYTKSFYTTPAFTSTG